MILITGTVINFSFSSSSASTEDNDSVQEMTYEQIINELNFKKRKNQKLVQQENSFEQLQVHLGVGYLNSFSTFRISESLLQRYQNGMQIMIGMDLFDPSWYTEIAFRNFGVTNNGAEEIMLKEFALKMAYIQEAKPPWKYFFSTGVSNRFFHYRDRLKNIAADNVTPSWIASMGLKAYFDKKFNVGFEMQGRSSLVGSTSDVSSIDFAIRMETSL